MASIKQTFFALLVAAFGLCHVHGFNNIQSVEVYTDDCNDCGMTFLGRIELEVKKMSDLGVHGSRQKEWCSTLLKRIHI